MIQPKKETLKDGTTVWRARGVSCGKWPSGKRRLRTITGKTKKEVEAEVARITGARANGTYVHPWNSPSALLGLVFLGI